MEEGQMQSSAIWAFESETCVMISLQKLPCTESVLEMGCTVRNAL